MVRIRQSNFELLRIVSMLLVVVTHVNFYSLGWPQPSDLSIAPKETVVKLFFESLSICCVNVFVLISGWFRLKPSASKFFNLLFQCFFFSFGLLLVAFISKDYQIGTLYSEIKRSLLLRDYWFITSYILLILLSPVLNAFVDNTSKKTHLSVVCCFFLYQTIYGWFIKANGINSGYSTISFIGLYLLAQFIKKYLFRATQLKSSLYFLAFFICCILNTLICIIMLKTGRGIQRFFYYTNPLVILSSVLLILAFSKIELYNKTINYIASSALAVYLFHQNHFVSDDFKRMSLCIYLNNDVLHYFLKIILFVISVFVISVIIDQIRKFLGRLFYNIIFSANSVIKTNTQ